jgi:adenosylcobinamide kinase/adenosylcobinamide-phosphate guanylyltransferase
VIVLITGPVRSGKSAFALELARESARSPVYVATCEVDARDPEMTDRVARHRAERGPMRAVETNEHCGPTLIETLTGAGPGEILIVDSLGTWLAAHLLALADRAEADPVAAAGELAERTAKLLVALESLTADVVFISEETGWGVVPPTVLGRLFRDELGRTARAVAAHAARTYLVVAGYAVELGTAGRRITG